MTKKAAKKRKGSRNAPPSSAAPKVHVQVAVADNDMLNRPGIGDCSNP